jgi:hypothetical protein
LKTGKQAVRTKPIVWSNETGQGIAGKIGIEMKSRNAFRETFERYHAV